MRTAKDLSRAPVGHSAALRMYARGPVGLVKTHELKPRARQFYSRVLNRQLWRVHAPKMYDGCGTTLEGALRVFRANNQLT